MIFKAVVFDLDDTLHDDTASYRHAAACAAREVAGDCGVDPEALRRVYAIEAESFWENLSERDLKKGSVSLRCRLWGAALRTLGVDDPAFAERAAQAFNAHRGERTKLFPGVSELLASLRERGIALGLLTNGFAETHREKLTLLRLEQSFDEVVIADEVGMFKPDPRIFAHTCERLGASPSASVMVGDRFDRDVLGGQAAGLQTIWFNMRGENVPAGATPPDAIVRDIGELALLLG